jgi:hypothetical protein
MEIILLLLRGAENSRYIADIVTIGVALFVRSNCLRLCRRDLSRHKVS